MKTAVITGGSRGIGRAIAMRLASEGYAAAVNYCRNEAAALEVCDIIRKNGGTAAAYKADVSDRKAMTEMFEKIEHELGAADVLVNNAGIAGQVMFQDISDADWDRLFDVDVKGVYIASQLALKNMLHRKHGRIINISSMWGVTGGSCEVHYSAAKAAVIGMTKALAKELGPSGITVNCIAPGVIDTEMNGHLDSETMADLAAETPLMRIGTPEDVAAAAAFLASENASFITGQILSVDGGIAV